MSPFHPDIVNRDRTATAWALVAMYRYSLVKHARYLTSDLSEAEDWVSEACLRAPELAANWDETKCTDFRAYMLYYLKMYVMHGDQDKKRRAARLQRKAEREQSRESVCIIDGDVHGLLRRLARIDEELAIVLRERYLNNKSVRMIAIEYRCTRTAIDKLLARAIEEARKLIDAD